MRERRVQFVSWALRCPPSYYWQKYGKKREREKGKGRKEGREEMGGRGKFTKAICKLDAQMASVPPVFKSALTNRCSISTRGWSFWKSEI
jgi:hypothetical protein